MAQSYEVKLGDYQDTIHITVEGQEQVIAVLRTIQNELDGLGLSKFYGDEKKLIDNVTSAMSEFNKENGKTQANAENLIKTINALSGIQGKDWSEFFPDADWMRDIVSEARKLAGVLNGYSVDNFREAGIAFESMGAGFEGFRARIDDLISGEGDIARIKADLAASAAEVERLIRQVDSLNDELQETRSERDKALDGGKIKEFNALIAQAEREFEAFLAANNIDKGDFWRDAEFNGILSDLKEGLITSGEAITRFKGEFREFLPKDASDGLEVFFTKLEEIAGKLGEVQGEIQNLHSGGLTQNTAAESSSTVAALEGERKAVSDLVGLTPDAEAFTKILMALAEAAGDTGSETSKLASELKPVADIIRSITENSDAEKLQSVSRIIGGIKSMADFKLRPTSLNNLKDGLEGLSKIQNTSVLTELSALDFNKLGAFKFSKDASNGLRDLAEYLPVIGSADAENLKKLQGLDLSGLGNIKVPEVPKDNIASLAELGKALSEAAAGVGALTTSLNAAGKSGAANLQKLVGGGLSGSQIGSILKSGLGADGMLTTSTSLRHIGMTAGEADQIAKELGEMYGNITNVSAEWKTFANGAKDAAVITVKAVGDIGETLSQKLIYRLQDVKDEAGEVRKEWKLDESGKVSINYGAMEKAAEAERKAAEKAAEADRKAAEKAAEAERKAAEKAAEAERKAAEADRKAAEKAAEADRKAAEESQRLAEQMANGRADAARERVRAAEQAAQKEIQIAEQAAQKEIQIAEQEAERKRQASEMNAKQAESELIRLKALRIDYQNQIDKAGELGIDNDTVSGLRKQVEEIDRMLPELEKIASKQVGAAAGMDAYKDSIKRARDELTLLKKQLAGDIKSSGAFVPMNVNQADIASRTISARRTATEKEIGRATAAGLGDSEQVKTLRELIPLYDDLDKQVKENTISQADYTEWMRLFKAVTDDVGVTLGDNVKEVEDLEKQYAGLMDTMSAAKFDNETKNGVWGMASEEDIQKLDRLTREMDVLSEAYGAGKINAKQYSAILNGISLEYDKLSSSVTRNSRMQKLADQDAAKRRADTLKGLNVQRMANSEVSNATKMLRDYSAAERSRNEESRKSYANIGTIRSELMQLTQDYINGKWTLEEYTQRVNDYSAALRENGAVIEVNGDNHMTWFDKVGKALSTHLTTLSATALIGSAMREVRQMVSTVIEIDTAMTDLKKVTDETDSRYAQFLDNAAVRAKNLSATISDTVSATADFARLGLSIEQAEAAADAAIVYKAVGDDIESIGDASESIISTMKAFRIEAENSMTIVDKFNKVGNEFAIGSNGVGEALKRSASAMAAANNTLEESIGLATAANTILQNPQSVGTMMKTVSMYVRAAKTELEEAGEETDGIAESTGKLRELILQITREGGKAVDIMADDHRFKSTYQILEEISEVWNKISDTNQAALLEKLGGKRNANAIAAILENFDIARKAMEAASNAEGSAIAELEKFQQSIQGHIVGFKTAYQELAQTVIDGNLAKSFIDIGKWGLNALTVIGKLADALGGLRTAIIVLGGNLLGRGLSALVRILSDASAETGHFKSGIAGIIQKLVDARKAGKTFGDVMKAAMSALGTAPGIFTLISVAISGVLLAIDHYNKKQQEMIDKAREIKETYRDAVDTYNSNITTLEGLREEFEKLSEGVDEHGGNVSLTADEYSHYLELIDQIVAISPQVIEGYNKEGDAILDYKKALEKAIEKQNELLKNQRAIMLGGGEELFSGNAAELAQVRQKLVDRLYQNKPGAKTLESSLNTAGILDLDKSASQISAWRGALRDLGITLTSWSDMSTDSAIKLYDNADEFMNALRESGAYTEKELATIQTRLNALAAPITEYNALIQDGTQYLQEWVKDQDWYEDIPDDALSGFSKGLSDIVAKGADFGETLNATIEYGSKFAEVFGSKQVKAIQDLAGGLGDASRTEEEAAAKLAEYHKEVEKFISGLNAAPNVSNALTSYFAKLEQASYIAPDPKEVAKRLTAERDGIQARTNALEEYIGAYDDLIAVEQEAADAGYKDRRETVFGNIDTNSRQILNWTQENIDKYRDVLESWGYAEDDLQDMLGSYSTVMGTSSFFQTEPNGNGVEIAFSPILQTADGPVLLGEDTLYKYIYALIDKVHDIPGSNLSDLFYFDRTGLEVDGMRISNMLAAVGDEAIRVGEVMHYAGKEGALAEAMSALKEAAGSAGISLDGYRESIEGFRTEAREGAAEIAALDRQIAEAGASGAAESTTPMTQAEKDFADFKKQIGELGRALGEFQEQGSVTSETYQELAKGNEKYAELFTITGNGVEINTDKLNTYVESLKQEYGAKLAMNGATTEEIGILAALADTLVTEAETSEDAATEIAELRKYIDSMKEGTQLSGAEVDKLVKKYPKLTSAVKGTEKGYRIEISALEDLIELKSEYIRLTEQETAVTEARNRLNLHNNGNTTAASKIDEIFTKYEKAYGKAIASFEDFKKGYEDVFGRAYEGSYAEYENYINALIDKNDALAYALMRVKDAAEGVDAGYTPEKTKETTESVSDLISELDKLSGMVKELNEGTEYSTTETLNLISKYPSLRNHIIKTANGYKFETSAIKELIAAKVQLMQTADMEMHVASVRSELRDANADKADVVFAKYLADNGRNIETLDEYKAAYKAYYGFAAKASTAYAQAKIDAIKGALVDENVSEIINTYLDEPLPGYKPEEEKKESSKTEEDVETEFEKAYKLHQHYLAMNQETEEQYLNWLDGAYQASFAAGEMELDDYYKYEEEVHEKRKQLFQTSLDESQHQIDLLSHQLGDTSAEQIAIYEQMQKKVHAKANEYRAMGISDNDELIRELQNQWWQYEENIRQLRESAFSDWLSDRKFVIEQLKQDKVSSNEILDSWRDVLERINDEIAYYSAKGYDITTDVIQNLMNELQSAKEAMIAELDDVVAKANEVVDGFQNIYTTLTNAAKEYASTGYLSVDSLQSILALGPKYMTMLDSENGQLVINEQSLQKIIAARTDEMAAETALSYAKQVLLATEQDEVQTLRDLAGVQAAASSNIWEQAYATLGYARALGASKGINDSYYTAAIANVEKMQSVAKTAADTVSDYYKTLNDGYVSQADGLEQILKLTEDMIKQENADRVEALEKEKELYKDIIDEKKEILRLTKEQSDHDRDMADKLKEISDLQSKIDQLALDDSREAGAQRAKLEAQLLEKQKALADDQADYAYDAQVDALDKQYDAFEEEKDDEIESLKEELNSAEKLYRAAVERITDAWENDWEGLKNQLISWNFEVGNTLEKDLTAAWDAATAAAERYGDFVSALAGTKEHDKLGPDSTDKEKTSKAVEEGMRSFVNPADYINRMRANSLAWFTAEDQGTLEKANRDIAKELEEMTGERLSYDSQKGVWNREDGTAAYRLTEQEVGHAVVSAMKANSAAWKTASKSEQEHLEEMNEKMAKRLSAFLGKPITKTAAGVWMLGSDKLYDIYHRGGIVGGRGSAKQNEVMALLEKGEAVLDERRESALYKTVDFVQMLSEKIGHAIDKGRLSSLLAGTGRSFPAAALPALAGGVGTMNFAPTVQVTIAGAGELSESTARKYGSIAADTVLEQLKNAFTQRGVSAAGNSILK